MNKSKLTWDEREAIVGRIVAAKIAGTPIETGCKNEKITTTNYYSWAQTLKHRQKTTNPTTPGVNFPITTLPKKTRGGGKGRSNGYVTVLYGEPEVVVSTLRELQG
jgi:hypothetical protein